MCAFRALPDVAGYTASPRSKACVRTLKACLLPPIMHNTLSRHALLNRQCSNDLASHGRWGRMQGSLTYSLHCSLTDPHMTTGCFIKSKADRQSARGLTLRPAITDRTRGPAFGMAKTYRSWAAECLVNNPTFSSRDSCASTILLSPFISLSTSRVSP